jgi:hypothetical protein
VKKSKTCLRPSLWSRAVHRDSREQWMCAGATREYYKAVAL